MELQFAFCLARENRHHSEYDYKKSNNLRFHRSPFCWIFGGVPRNIARSWL